MLGVPLPFFFCDHVEVVLQDLIGPSECPVGGCCCHLDVKPRGADVLPRFELPLTDRGKVVPLIVEPLTHEIELSVGHEGRIKGVVEERQHDHLAGYKVNAIGYGVLPPGRVTHHVTHGRKFTQRRLLNGDQWAPTQKLPHLKRSPVLIGLGSLPF